MTLNPSQLKAVETNAALAVVMSGPGSGKTTVATERAKRLLCAGRKVVALTYTNTAAHEFRERATVLNQKQSVRMVLVDPRLQFCGTLHAYCFRLIRTYGRLIGYSHDGVSMLPPGDADELLEEVRDSLGVKTSIRELHEIHDSKGGMVEQVWTEYRFRLKRNNLVDYDRILADGYALLQFDEVRKAEVCHDLIVEEAQDSAAIDWSIYNAIPADDKFIIGDIDQAIFEWRAAYPEGLLRVASTDEAEILTLEDNYRCASAICDAANRLIAHNLVRYDKQTVSATGEQGAVTVNGFAEPWAEMGYLAESIRQYQRDRPSITTIAVLCRTNHGVKQVRDFLDGSGLRVHRAYSRGRFNQPSDWRRASLLIGLVVAPFNEIIAEQLLRLDHPAAEVKRWRLESSAAGRNLADRVGSLGFDRDIGSGIEGLLHFLAVNHVSESTVAMIQQRAALLPESATPADLLQDMHSHDVFEQEQPGGTIYTGTIHSAKGREFDVVFLPMFEESKTTDQNLEEERRLAFVAVTRARTYVHISFSDQRTPRWGSTERTQPSRFIAEMGLCR